MLILEKHDADAIPPESVIVTVWHSGGRTVADVTCTSCPAADDYIVADFPRPVPIALERAEQVRSYCGLQRIAVVLTNESLWRSEWGNLQSGEKVH